MQNLGDWAYAEIGRLDPEGRGDVSTELVPGVPVRLSPHIVRVTAPNGNMMTGPGTNAYFLGPDTDGGWALLDAGPDDDEHPTRPRARRIPASSTRRLDSSCVRTGRATA